MGPFIYFYFFHLFGRVLSHKWNELFNLFMSFILLFYFKVFKSCVKINYCKINVLDIKTGKESNFESFTTQLMCVSYPESLGYLFKRFSSLVSVLKFLLTKEHSNRKLANIFTPMAKSFNHKSNSYPKIPNGPSHLPRFISWKLSSQSMGVCSCWGK